VRFGNVLGSSGSVVPLFLEQIQQGGPVTVTDPEMTRFIMPIEEAANLVLNAHEKMTSGEIFVLKMPAFRVGCLAEAMIEEFAPLFGYSTEEITIEIIGARPGERVHEKLISTDEKHHARELDDMYVILPEVDLAGYEPVNYSEADSVESEYTSADEQLLTGEEIIEIIDSTMNVSDVGL
jgi:FlaA1/EpsC-like NDP-sugar epimerase